MMNNRLTFSEAELLQQTLKAGISQMRSVLVNKQSLQDFLTAMDFIGVGAGIGEMDLGEVKAQLRMKADDLQKISDKLYDIFGI